MPRQNKTKYATPDELGEQYDLITEEFELAEGEELDAEILERVEERRAEMQQEAEKTTEQAALERKRRFQMFHYNPPIVHTDEDGVVTKIEPTSQWAGAFIAFLFILCIVNTVLTLDQWHGTHAWRLPFDVVPADQRPGGWPQENHNYRFSGAIIGTMGAAFSWVMRPTADKFKCFTWMLLIAAILDFVAFGYDFHRLEQAKDLPYCKGINDMKTNKFLCEFDEYRATVIFDIICGFLNIILGTVYCYNATAGNVSRRMVYNEATSTFEKMVPDPDKPWHYSFPRAFRSNASMFSYLSALAALCSAILVGLSATQSAGSFVEPPGYPEPIFNGGYEWPRNVYVIHGTDAFRNGSWPERNFDLRLGANVLALVLLGLLIQWRRDGRGMQLCVITLSIVAACMFLGAFAIDYDLIKEQWEEKGCPYENSKSQICKYERYYATIITEAFAGFLLLIFNIRNLVLFLQQCKRPVERNHAPYGWWCNGEWENEEDDD
eukprot:Hpha_TRINITY_DN15900_c0_g6::TRINITY_DN15900_c0_g6_i2::g.73737::m.73737